MLNEFANLYRALLIEKDKTSRFILWKNFLDPASDTDKWTALKLLQGYKSKSLVKRNELLAWVMEFTEIADWLIQESYKAVGDWAETFSLLIGNAQILSSGLTLSEFMIQLEQPRTNAELKEFVQSMWFRLSPSELFLFHKMISGSLKSIKETHFLTEFMVDHHRVDPALIAMRLSLLEGITGSYSRLLLPEWTPAELNARPYPFYLPSILEQKLSALYEPHTWIAEPYINGYRIQCIRRGRETYLWSVENEFPSLSILNFINLHNLPDGMVLDGVITTQQTEVSIPNSTSHAGSLVSKHLIILDMLEWDFKDIRQSPLIHRKKMINDLINALNDPVILPVPSKEVEDWRTLNRNDYPGGWVLKKKNGFYNSGQEDWLRLTPSKKEIYALLMYAEAIPRQSQGYLCTFGVYNDQQVAVPIVKLSTESLGEAMVTQLHYWIQNNIVQKFGPVRVVRSQQIFLITYDKTIENKRVKAGFSLKNAQIKKWETRISSDLKIGLLEHLNSEND